MYKRSKKHLCYKIKGSCQSASTITALATPANYIIVYAVANGAGGTSMKCWDPSTTASVTCTASQWTCQVYTNKKDSFIYFFISKNNNEKKLK